MEANKQLEEVTNTLKNLTVALDKLIISDEKLTESHSKLTADVNSAIINNTQLTTELENIKREFVSFKADLEAKEREKNIIIFGMKE